MRASALLRRAARHRLDAVVRATARRRARHYPIARTIVLMSSPRGGSTWLGENLMTLPGSVQVWEPLEPSSRPHVGTLFGWDPYLEPGAPIAAGSQDWERREYLRQTLTGENFTLDLAGGVSQLHWPAFVRFERYVVKCVRGLMLLPWLTQEFPVRALHLVRHPCAVVASQRAMAWHGALGWRRRFEGFLQQYDPSLLPVMESLETPEEVLAFDWAVTNLVPLRAAPRRWLLVSYETLATERARELTRVYDYLDVPMPTAAEAQLDRHSATVLAGKQPSRLDGYRTSLSRDEIARILRVVHAVGVDLYDDGPMPRADSTIARRDRSP